MKKNNKVVSLELSAEDIAAIKRSEEQIERGEYIELDESFRQFKRMHPEANL